MKSQPSSGRIERSETVYAGRIISVDVERVVLPGDHVVDMEIVRHPGSVVLLPLPSPGEIVLIRQYRHAVGRWIWELPAGTLNRGEDAADAARRECEEEIGYVPGAVERLFTCYPSPGFCDETMTFFVCTDLRVPPADSTVEQDADEEIEPRTFPLAEADAMLERGDIEDMKTVVGLDLLRRRRMGQADPARG
jgi:ADP-ribose pyrophosphatase